MTDRERESELEHQLRDALAAESRDFRVSSDLTKRTLRTAHRRAVRRRSAQVVVLAVGFSAAFLLPAAAALAPNHLRPLLPQGFVGPDLAPPPPASTPGAATTEHQSAQAPMRPRRQRGDRPRKRAASPAVGSTSTPAPSHDSARVVVPPPSVGGSEPPPAGLAPERTAAPATSAPEAVPADPPVQAPALTLPVAPPCAVDGPATLHIGEQGVWTARWTGEQSALLGLQSKSWTPDTTGQFTVRLTLLDPIGNDVECTATVDVLPAPDPAPPVVSGQAASSDSSAGTLATS